ncbi:TIGR02391 family protein [Kribbella sp. NPDC059898]|uniref:TIGR02391 family protein n=1 Tax=Kribbella sp. NPDC059898 TaxID=3346995 RepID=UPI00366A2780
MTATEAWKLDVLRGVADVLGDTENGLTGSQIADLLGRLRFPDPQPAASKRARLLEAFIARHNQDRSAKRIVTFITYAMAPAGYVGSQHLFTWRQDHLNEVLTFAGLRVTDTGQVARGASSSTLDEAARHAASLQSELRRRRTHAEVLRYCTLEVFAKNNFHAQLEAAKSVFDRLRVLSGSHGDGAQLVDDVLALGQSGMPKIAINSLQTPTERDEQKGFANLIKGLAGLYRNPVAHDPRLTRAVADDELLELLTTLSMIHRRLDTAAVR